MMRPQETHPELERRLVAGAEAMRAQATSSIADRVLSRLDEVHAPASAGRRPPWAFAAGLAAAAALCLCVFLLRDDGPPAQDGARADLALEQAIEAERAARPRGLVLAIGLDAPRIALGLTAEDALLAEADHLAQDTRKVARSLMGRMPLSDWLSRIASRD